jgi:two-component system, OmpR family, phosphate regulon response regulator PhoB
MTTVASPLPVASATAEFVVTVTVNADPGQDTEILTRFTECLRAAFELASPALPTQPTRAHHDWLDASLSVDVPSRKVWLHGAELELTRLEFDLLAYLCRHPGRVATRSTLLSEVWHLADTNGGRTVDVHIRRLRHKLGDDLPLITTVRKVGYRLESTVRTHITE